MSETDPLLSEPSKISQPEQNEKTAHRRRFNIAPVVNKIIDEAPQDPERIMEIIREAIDEENRQRAQKAEPLLRKNPVKPDQDSDQQKIETNILVASILIPYYEVYSQILEDITQNAENSEAISPFGTNGFCICMDRNQLNSLVHREKERLAKTQNDYAQTHIYIRNEQGNFNYAQVHKDKRTGNFELYQSYPINAKELPKALMATVYSSTLHEVIKEWLNEEDNASNESTITTDKSLKARYAALEQSLLHSRQSELHPSSVFTGGFGVGLSVYEHLYDYVEKQAAQTVTEDDTDHITQELSRVLGIPVKVANHHIQYFLDLREHINKSIADGSLLRAKREKGVYSLNPNHRVYQMLINCDAEDNVITGCPAIVQGIITNGFRDYIKLRQHFYGGNNV